MAEFPGLRLEAMAARPVRAMFVRRFLRAAGPVDQRWLDIAVRRRLGDRNLLPSERARLERRHPHACGCLSSVSWQDAGLRLAAVLARSQRPVLVPLPGY
jgi:hypothetical protein